ncbi:Canalicular multispecific organic anion transporter 1 [Haplosporangium sp. Z 767]|nr:Canalicular multispecific organic anion transporter 1 [Haplosporangium sp. Z 767]
MVPSPLYQHFSETVSGVSMSDMMANRMHMYTLMNRWLHVRIEFLGGFIVFATATFAVLNVDKLNPSLFGLALSYALNMIGYIDFLVSTISEVQNLLVFVERIKEYSEKPTEASLVTDVLLPEN